MLSIPKGDIMFFNRNSPIATVVFNLNNNIKSQVFIGVMEGWVKFSMNLIHKIIV